MCRRAFPCGTTTTSFVPAAEPGASSVRESDMRWLVIVLVASAALSSACASRTASTAQARAASKASSVAKAPPAPQAVSARITRYSGDEITKMTLCVGLADTAMTVADQKLRGRPLQDVKASYASKANAQVTVPLVEKVYGDTFRLPSDYSVDFFKECAHNMANVAPQRVSLAAYCMQNGMIAGVAQTYRDAGLPKERAYQRFARFEGDTPKSIIDSVYARSVTRSEAMLDTWHACMAPLTSN